MRSEPLRDRLGWRQCARCDCAKAPQTFVVAAHALPPEAELVVEWSVSFRVEYAELGLCGELDDPKMIVEIAALPTE